MTGPVPFIQFTTQNITDLSLGSFSRGLYLALAQHANFHNVFIECITGKQMLIWPI